MKWRKWNRIIHRDLGYFFSGAILIYAISGIAINHRNDWNPNYSVTTTEFEVNLPSEKEKITEEMVMKVIEEQEQTDNFKKFYFPTKDKIKVFLNEGNMMIYLDEGIGVTEILRKRPIIYQSNYLHYNPHKWWTWFSDIFAVALILITISGALIVRGKKGIKGKGALFIGAGILVPILFLIFL